MNSPLCLWLLSSIILAVFGWAYQRYEGAAKWEQDRANKLSQITLEVQNRCKETRNYAKAFPNAETDRIRNHFDGEGCAPIYTELDSRSVTSLLFELQSVINRDKTEQKDEIEKWLKSWPPDDDARESSLLKITSLEQILEKIASSRKN